MSLTAAVYGPDFIAIGADHGQWKIAPDGTAHSPSVHSRSKLHVVPDCPMVLAAVGPSDVGAKIDAFLEAKAYNRETYRIADAMKELWPELFAWWDPIARERLQNVGLDADATIAQAMKGEKIDFATRQQRCLAGLDVVAYGIDYIGVPRIFRGAYPNPDLTIANFSIADMSFCSGLLALGSHDCISGFADAGIDFRRLDAAGGVELVRFMLDTVDRAEGLRAATGGTRTVTGPYDVCLLTMGGTEWIQGGVA